MTEPVLYADRLVEVDEQGMRLKNYYFPFGSKYIRFDQVKSWSQQPATLLNGKWRIWGSGDLRTWFPLDWQRPQRDTIFFLTLTTQNNRIGFTVEHTEPFLAQIKNKINI